MRSNTYTLIFTSITTIVLGFLLSFVSTSLKETQEINEEIDIMKNILYSLDFSEKDDPWTVEEVKKIFDSSVIQKVVSVDGEVIDNLVPSEIPPDKMETQFPLYIKIVNNCLEKGLFIKKTNEISSEFLTGKIFVFTGSINA